jgi:elongator complex protein 2
VGTQIHGHDFACMAVLPGAAPPCYAVGSEEKVIRVLEAPQAFEQTLALARGHAMDSSSSGKQVCRHHIHVHDDLHFNKGLEI